MSRYNEFRHEFERGIKGESIWIPLAQPKLNKYISVTNGMYALLGGVPGTGKTAILDDIFVLSIYDWWKNTKEETGIELRWVYRSMERRVSHKVAKWVCYKIYRDHGLKFDVPTILQWGNRKFDLNSSHRKLIDSYTGYFEEMLEFVKIVDGVYTPKEVFNLAEQTALSRGKLVSVDAVNKVYKPNNSRELLFHCTDHVGKLKDNGNGDKATIDEHSMNMSILRDKYGYFVVDVSQLNRGIFDTSREVDINPSDFKGSSDLYENCDLAIGALNPYKHTKSGEGEYLGYDINAFVNEEGNNRFRSIKLIKNSFGIDEVVFPLNFIGECGAVTELPSPSMFNSGHVNYVDYV